MKKIAVFTLIFALLCCGCALAGKTSAQAFRGTAMEDFSVETTDGGVFTLSEALKTKKAVIISFWATWCGACEEEFSSLQAAFEAYADDAAIIAISIEKTDSAEIMNSYAEAHGLSFLFAGDNALEFRSTYATAGVPVNIAVDRFGNIAFLEAGSATFDESFTLLLERLCADDYTETVIIDGYPEPAGKNGVMDRRENRTCTSE